MYILIKVYVFYNYNKIDIYMCKIMYNVQVRGHMFIIDVNVITVIYISYCLNVIITVEYECTIKYQRFR